MRNHKKLLTLAVMAIFVGEFLEKEAIGCPLRFDGGLINGLSTASVDSLHGNLKVARRQGAH